MYTFEYGGVQCSLTSLFQIAYTVIIAPIAIVRFMEMGGHDVPFVATIFT